VLVPRAFSLQDAAAYSGVPVRALWRFVADGRLMLIRLPDCRRVLLDRLDLDALLEAHKTAGGTSPERRAAASRAGYASAEKRRRDADPGASGPSPARGA